MSGIESRGLNYNEYYYFRKPDNLAHNLIKFWHKRMFDIAVQQISGFKKKSLLEVGVGWGYFGETCIQNGINYSGIEMNKRLAETAVKKGLNVIVYPVPPFPKIEERIQIIWMSHIIEHATDYLHAREILSSAYEKLDKGGYIIIICPDFLSWKKEFYNVDWSHGFPTTLRRVSQMLRDIGFKIIFAKHHTLTVINSFLVTILTFFFSLMPISICDYILIKCAGKDYCYSFMTLFGWRQIYIIAQKS